MADDDNNCPICGMEFDNEADMLIHHQDCEVELNDELDAAENE